MNDIQQVQNDIADYIDNVFPDNSFKSAIYKWLRGETPRYSPVLEITEAINSLGGEFGADLLEYLHEQFGEQSALLKNWARSIVEAHTGFRAGCALTIWALGQARIDDTTGHWNVYNDLHAETVARYEDLLRGLVTYDSYLKCATSWRGLSDRALIVQAYRITRTLEPIIYYMLTEPSADDALFAGKSPVYWCKRS